MDKRLKGSYKTRNNLSILKILYIVISVALYSLLLPFYNTRVMNTDRIRYEVFRTLVATPDITL